ncbi:MAG: Rne/Rng family ribonuclease [Pseudomonadota bacterium]
MKKDHCSVLVSTDPFETRVVVLKDDNLDRYFLEREVRGNVLGSIFSGRVVKVIPGIRAAFIDVGLERSAFLPATQVVSQEVLEAATPEEKKAENGRSHRKRRRGVGLIEKSIREGESITVQVINVPGREKGPKVTTYFSIPGHYLVFMPTVRGLGVSRKIKGPKERARLRKVGEMARKQTEGGFVIRSAAEGVREEDIMREAKWLHRRWQDAVAGGKRKKRPFLLLPELSLAERVLRDMSEEAVHEVIVNDAQTLQRLKQYAENSGMKIADKISLWAKDDDLFESLGVEEKIERTFARKVALGSGGHIVIDHAEALTAIDVNTGSFTENRDASQTVLTTNMEAVRQIAYQLRLRCIGGLIILDLIDMEREDHKEMVYRELVKEVRKDKAKVSVRKISDMGLIEMTREHYGPRVIEMLQERCWYCDGTGNILGRDTISGKMIRSVIRALQEKPKDLLVTAHQSMVLRMENEFSSYVRNLEKDYQVKIIFEARIDVHIEYFKISYM